MFFDRSAPRQKAKAMERALQHLRAKVVSGDLMPGEQIRQEEMAQHLGVSRVPLREALNVLADQGLLNHRPNSGYFVAKRAPNELAQISRILQLLENELLMSIEWPDAALLKTLRSVNDQMRAVVTTSDWTPLIRLNREFHLMIYSLSPSRLILQEVERLWQMADIFIATKMSDIDARLRTVEEHDRIIDGLLSYDHQVCVNLMEAHRASTASGIPVPPGAARPSLPMPVSRRRVSRPVNGT